VAQFILGLIYKISFAQARYFFIKKPGLFQQVSFLDGSLVKPTRTLLFRKTITFGGLAWGQNLTVA
jgi:hypothetical protein